ncbi:MAG: tRNA (N(6)-L-threonylcarbamoyladenosine(37)-C(2))-methylthiotransferase MtaB [Flavobacteriaceae bacterium]|jgi:threonylcarbamoyladenosine tRNA methylthiotransferase MtaB|nr:MAG: 2-methylthioadenine synthetase [Polaribacter sp. BACL8 MAG-120531-bin13]KRP03973.1 MAG: 2-methylthioadenine synthetase [Polaribacter sp. BACL8 MAG-120619-bin41]MCO4778947.1 tRNA (N(6)-L-threonylcarbamoyladenosine(37)-C(2))-methylthiotransferase MtaB [Flavobacteriaceae bacterium]NQV62487.1 tRNA (N(6)-L-threonylcarbamoyladenosine(37)-C(2))-methylthiotransferase MtaB [Cryomorphaceae bacterium]MCO4853339.1 tRNA (N(6)-L-threonylcarbamoyladenosine(37)-C(2))-methylthiotransferase MtaB [Flavoba|tara:strand:- start:20336 stop:21655 length:1320 start_codon:yes stop_codon:yes gene_type:complete
MKKKVAFHTLGCKLNFSETATIASQMEAADFEKVPFDSKADVYVINTCSVTENADKRFKEIVKKTQKINEKAFVAAVGCYAQLKPEALADVDGVDLVLGATEKFNLTAYLNDLTKQEVGTVHACEIEEADFYVGGYAVGERTRAFLKVQDGCDYKCTYCTIPLARGISRSDTLENVLKNAQEIASKGIKEIVLTGVNIGDYGKGEFGNKKHLHTFFDLVQALEKIPGISRLRISSIEPNLLKNETIDMVSKSRVFVPHFHIPLQSGSDTVLKKMKRRYLTGLYRDRITTIQRQMPHACIGVDVIVGFPGETEEDFLETYAFLNQLGVSYLHVFTYSERDRTEAASMSEVVPMAVRNKRSKMLRGLSVKLRRAFYESQIETKRTVLFEGENKKGYIHGFTENYVKVKTPWDPALVNTVAEVRLKDIDDDGLVRFDYMENS